MFDYQKYFRKITPKTKIDIFNRFLFAFCSVHTTWQRNVIGYNLLKDDYPKTRASLRKIILQAGLGLTNQRAEYIMEFTEAFKHDHKFFAKKRNEDWIDYAERLQKNIKGLGFAKTRFAIELIYPNKAEIVCADTHIIQWAKQNPNKMNKTLYKKIEKGFLNHSKQQKLHPIESRWKFWDNKQGFDNPRYWSWCLE